MKLATCLIVGCVIAAAPLPAAASRQHCPNGTIEGPVVYVRSSSWTVPSSGTFAVKFHDDNEHPHEVLELTAGAVLSGRWVAHYHTCTPEVPPSNSTPPPATTSTTPGSTTSLPSVVSTTVPQQSTSTSSPPTSSLPSSSIPPDDPTPTTTLPPATTPPTSVPGTTSTNPPDEVCIVNGQPFPDFTYVDVGSAPGATRLTLDPCIPNTTMPPSLPVTGGSTDIAVIAGGMLAAGLFALRIARRRPL